MSILVVGTVAFDAIETPFGKTDKIIGGAATYICLSASYISKQLNIVSVVGEDFPKKGIEMLKKHNTNIEGLQIKKGEKTFFWSGKYHENMNNRDTIETQLNVLEKFNPIEPKKHQENDLIQPLQSVLQPVEIVREVASEHRTGPEHGQKFCPETLH